MTLTSLLNQDPHDVAVPTDIADIMPKLRACMEALMENKGEVIDMLLQRVQEYMEEYDDPNNKDHIPVDNSLVIDALQSDIVDKLGDAVKLMVAAGFETECCHVYSSCRREFLEEILSGCRRRREDWMCRKRLKTLANFDTDLGFGLQELDVEDVPEDRIVIWVETFHIAMRILFPNERRLCERVFSGFTSATDLAFMDVCGELTISLLHFANSFAAWNELPLVGIKIPRVLETLLGLVPEFQSLFSELTNDPLRNEAINPCKRLEEATKGIFTEFENWICHDRAMADFSGWICPISRDAMGFLGVVSKSRVLLEKVFQENSLVAHGQGTSSSLSTQTAKIMELLDRQLEVKSKIDADPALYYFLLMNNRCYIEQSVKRSNELGEILGDDWIQNHSAKVQQSLEDYQRTSWDKVLGLLKLDGNEPITTESMIKNLESFNMQFKEICRTQSTWFVLDDVLRKKIRGSLEKIVLPTYGKFIDRLQTILGRQSDGYIRFSMDDIDYLLNDLFRESLRISSWKRRF